MKLKDAPSLWVFDIETDGLLDEVTTFHCAVFQNVETNQFRGFRRGQEKELETFLSDQKVLIAHNGIQYDKQALNKLGVRCTNRVIDTLAISWYLELDRPKHGLESYGEQFGIKKPEINDWDNLTLDTYINRCTEDVKINRKLWDHQIRELMAIYRDKNKLDEFLMYLEFKMQMLCLQERNRWKMDVEGAEKLLNELEELSGKKAHELSQVMPDVPVFKTKKRPAKPFKKNGALSSAGIKWKDFCEEHNIDFNSDEGHKYIAGTKPPQPHYVPEVKEWLFSLGWKPETFQFKRNKETGEVKQIPQVTVKFSGGQICPSIERLANEVPEVQALVGYSMINHRKGFVRGMLNAVSDDGYLTASSQGFTNTLRMKHSAPLCNIPSLRASYGEEIRSLLTCGEDEMLLGSDLSSLESRCAHHYQMPIDPDYVKEQMSDDYDPHLNVAEAAGLLTPDQVRSHKDGSEDHSKMRAIGKNANYALQYSCGVKTLSRTCNVDGDTARRVYDAYHGLNWSIEKIAKSTKVKTVMGKKWQQNPVNGFWYFLKVDKDRFSTLCQGTGAYVFDVWCMNIKDISTERYGKCAKFIGAYHDEVILRLYEGKEDKMRKLVKDAMYQTNEKLGMLREMDCDIQFGTMYSQIH